MSEFEYWQVKYEEATQDRSAADIRFVMSFQPKISKDGNRFCIVIGENIQEGIAGFGETLMQAFNSINTAIYRESAVFKGKSK